LKSSWRIWTLSTLPDNLDLVYEEIVLHDQGPEAETENGMAMKYQKGTVYLRGEKVKMWYGKFLMYGKDQEGKEVKKHRNVAICKRLKLPSGKPSRCCERSS
jgi:hypothetical protein